MTLESIKELAGKLNKSPNPKKQTDWTRIKNLLNLYYRDRLKLITPGAVAVESGLNLEISRELVNEILGYKKWIS